MDDDTASVTASGGWVPITEFYRPIRASFPPFTVERGAVTFAKPPEGGWPAYVPPKVTRRQRWARRIGARKSRIGSKLVNLGHRWEGTTCHDDDCW